MLDVYTVLAKTESGAHEIAHRSGQLRSAERRILILADGRRNLAELDRYCRPGELAAIVDTLLRNQFVRLVRENEEAPVVEYVGADITQDIARIDLAMRHSDSRRSEPPENREQFRALKEAAAQELLEKAGFGGEVLAARIVGCSTPKALRILLRDIEAALAKQLGEAEATAFAKRTGAAAVHLS